jgi:hypothetical protein
MGERQHPRRLNVLSHLRILSHHQPLKGIISRSLLRPISCETWASACALQRTLALFHKIWMCRPCERGVALNAAKWLRTSKNGTESEEKAAASGIETGFRGSVQLSWLIFLEGKSAETRAGFGPFAHRTERDRGESKRLDRIEC